LLPAWPFRDPETIEIILVRIQKPVETYDMESYNRKAVCPNSLTALLNIFFLKILPFLLNIADIIVVEYLII
jgi:hypothetical protein